MLDGGTTVGIVTQNRRSDCLRAIESVFAQSTPYHVIVHDNASSDGTVEAIQRRFPRVEVIAASASTGPTGGRNSILDRVRSTHCFFMDDDAVLPHPEAIAQAVVAIETAPVVGVLGLIVIEDGRVAWGSRTTRSVVATQTFHGAGHLVRVSAVREVGGYAARLGIYTEESDLSIRLLDRGWFTAQCPEVEVIHLKNSNRDVVERRRTRWRNEIDFKLRHCPFEWLPLALLAQYRSIARVMGPWEGWREFRLASREARELSVDRGRHPVSRSTYRLWRYLGRGSTPINHLTMPTPRREIYRWERS